MTWLCGPNRQPVRSVAAAPVASGLQITRMPVLELDPMRAATADIGSADIGSTAPLRYDALQAQLQLVGGADQVRAVVVVGRTQQPRQPRVGRSRRGAIARAAPGAAAKTSCGRPLRRGPARRRRPVRRAPPQLLAGPPRECASTSAPRASKVRSCVLAEHHQFAVQDYVSNLECRQGRLEGVREGSSKRVASSRSYNLHLDTPDTFSPSAATVVVE